MDYSAFGGGEDDRRRKAAARKLRKQQETSGKGQAVGAIGNVKGATALVKGAVTGNKMEAAEGVAKAGMDYMSASSLLDGMKKAKTFEAAKAMYDKAGKLDPQTQKAALDILGSFGK
jgi:hypothetical protein